MESSICTPRYLPNELKFYAHIKKWIQPWCPSKNKWMNTLWYFQTMDYYSIIKRNELSSHIKIWTSMHVQSETTSYCVVLTAQHSKKSKSIAPVRRSMFARDLRGRCKVWKDEAKGIFRAMNYFLWYCNGGYMSLHIFSKPVELHRTKSEPYCRQSKK